MARRPHPFTAVGDPERRQNALLVILLVVTLTFAARLVYVQAIVGPALAQAAIAERLASEELVAPRGDIVDANGVVLATTVDEYDVIVDQTQIPDFRLREEPSEDVIGWGAAAAAEVLAPILGRDVNELGAQLVGEDRYHRLARGVSPEVWQAIAALRVNGVTPERRSQRLYPNGSTAGNVLGWVNADGAGAAGLEYTLDERLVGTNGEASAEIGATGQVIPTGERQRTPALPGCTVHTTIHSDLQWHTQTVIDETVSTFGAEWGAVVVVEVGTGRVLALADSRTVDPNDPTASAATDRGARSVQGFYDPGSTGKVLTVLSALEEGVVTPTTPIQDPYRLTTPNGQTFTNHTAHPDQVLTTTGVLAESSNTGTVAIGSMMSDETRYEYMRRFGWGEPTGLGLPSETPGLLVPHEQWDGRQRYTTMFGQGLSVSLVQNTQVFATIANQGMYVDPRIVDGYTCADGQYRPDEPATPRQVVSPESSQQMINMLESVVEDGGTGTLAAVEGYRIAGKTGTAQISDGAGGITDVAASFVGLAPADDPEIAVGVVIYRPSSGIFGGTIAAPAFQDVTAFALQSLGVAPSTTPATPYPLTPDSP